MITGLPTLHVIGDNIPQAYFRALKAVWEYGLPMRTQYDRKNEAGDYIDPPSRDARVLIEIKNPLSDPRFPPISFCEIGTYIAEIFGVKDHRVIPMSILRHIVAGNELSGEEKNYENYWPYTYHQRLVAHPESVGGDTFDQLASAIETIVKVPYSRRAMLTTSVPNLDPQLPEDIPCLREIQLRCVESEDGTLYLNPALTWRSRDLYKAWGDNMIGLTCFLQWVAHVIGTELKRPVELGAIADYSMSLHIYGQDFQKIQGDEEKGLAKFFDTFDEESFVARSLDSESATYMLVVPQLEELKSAKSIANWNFGQEQIDLINWLIWAFDSKTLKA